MFLDHLEAPPKPDPSMDPDLNVEGSNQLPAFMVGVVLLVLIAGLVLLPDLDAAQPRPSAQPIRPHVLRTLTAADGYDPIVTYDPADQRLVLTDHLPFGALVCIRGTCQLADGWVPVRGSKTEGTR